MNQNPVGRDCTAIRTVLRYLHWNETVEVSSMNHSDMEESALRKMVFGSTLVLFGIAVLTNFSIKRACLYFVALFLIILLYS